MYKIQAIAFDLDDTLLRSDSAVSLYTLDVLARCKQKGLRIISATGRPKSYHANRVLGAVRPLLDAEVYNNGCEGWNGDTRLFSVSIPGEQAAGIMRDMQQRFPGLPLAAETEQGLYASFDAHQWWPTSTPFTHTDWSTPIPNAYKLTTLPCGLGLSWQARMPFEQPYAEDKIRSLFPRELPILVMAHGWIVQALPPNVDKASGIERVLHMMGLSMTDCVTFGDDGNDVGMLQAAGVGVAMGNAFPYVLETIKTHTQSNDCDGVAKWLEQHILHQCSDG